MKDTIFEVTTNKMSKIDDITGWYARVYVEIKIIKNISKVLEEYSSFPIDVGAIVLKSKDGKRDYVLDTYYTEHCNNKEKVGEVFTFHSRLEVDKEMFPEEDDYNYNLTIEDLKDCTGEFYCNVDPNYMGVPDITCVFWMNGGYEQTHTVKLKPE